MRIEVHKIIITPYGEEISYRVMLPKGYDSSNHSYPVIYLNDGQSVFGGQYSVGESLEYTTYYNDYIQTLPQVIIVGIDRRAGGVERTTAFGPPTSITVISIDNGKAVTYAGTGDQYSKWIVEEFKPLIDKNYRTKPEGEWTGIGGYSSGGNSALYTQMTYPTVFSRVLMLGAAFFLWDYWFEEGIAHSNSIGSIKYLYMLCGTNEVTPSGSKERMLAANRNLFRQLLAKGLPPANVRFYEIKDGSHAISQWRPFFPDALRWVFQDIKNKC